MTTDEYEALVSAAVLGGPIELLNGRVMLNGEEFVFTPAQAAAAEALGIEVRSWIDAVLDDPKVCADIAAGQFDQLYAVAHPEERQVLDGLRRRAGQI